MNPKDFSVIYRDGILLVAEKPSGIPVHETKDPNRPNFTDLLKKKLNLAELRTVNRLDLPTSGLVLFGLDPNYNSVLDQILHSAKKYYIVKTRRPWEYGALRLESFLRDGKNGISHVRSGGKKAITHIFPIPNQENLLIAELITGRRHQIRAQLGRFGFPIFGDSLYGDLPTNRSPENRDSGLRKDKICLHAWKLVLDYRSEGITYNGLSLESFPSWISGEVREYLESIQEKDFEPKRENLERVLLFPPDSEN
jgi:23S rRNA-/tRNA-specific pseudouridylate synthase